MKNIIKQLTIVLMLLISISISAQTQKTVGTRITDDMTEKKLDNTAILDLDSSSKGFYMPRMNMAQREVLEEKLKDQKKAGNENTGLVIYNTTNDCIEYWHATTARWRSLCGSLPPAKIDLMEGCNNISISPLIKVPEASFPSWQQGMAFESDKHTIEIRVYVSQIGTYQIYAASENGYSFTAEGQFQSEGNYFITLKGQGAPKVGYDQNAQKKGDKLKLYFNGIESKKCPEGVDINITPANLNIKLQRAVYEAQNNYYVGQEMTEDSGNVINLKVDVLVKGNARVTAVNDVLGVGFVGEKEFTIDGPGQDMVLTPMTGKLIPKMNDLESYDLTFDVNVKPDELTNTINGATAKIKIEPTKVSIDSPNIDFGKEIFYQETAINAKHIITVPFKVLGSGKVDLKLKNAEGVEFEAKDVTFVKVKDENQTQKVTFTMVAGNTAKMPSTDSSEFTLTGTGGRFSISGSDKIQIALNKRPVAYTVDCAGIKGSRSTIIYDKPIEDTYYIKVPVNVIIPGEYELNTVSPVDGIMFSSTVNGKKAKFETPGENMALLYATDRSVIPKNKRVYTTSLVNNDVNTEKVCSTTFPVRVGYPELNVLYASYKSEMKPVDNYFKLGKRFGEDGQVVETGLVNVENFAVDLSYDDSVFYGAAFVANRKALADKIKSGYYNLIILDNTYALKGGFDQQIADALDYYVKNFTGTVIIPSLMKLYTSTDYFAYLEDESHGSGKKKTQVYTWIKNLNGKVATSVGAHTPDDNIGFIVPNSRFTFSNHYTQPNGYGLYRYKFDFKLNMNGGNFTPILKTREADPDGVGIAFVHNTYNVFFISMLDSTQDRDFFNPYYLNGVYDMKIPMDIHNGQKRAYTTFLGNLLAGIISDLMNK